MESAERMSTGHTYEIRSTGKSSAFFGDCEVCHSHVSEVFFQIERLDRIEVADLFGHRDCLLGARRA